METKEYFKCTRLAVEYIAFIEIADCQLYFGSENISISTKVKNPEQSVWNSYSEYLFALHSKNRFSYFF